MSQATLRTKTGCFPCRQRRKKCDERKPTCSACSRQPHRCVWPNEQQRKDRRSEKRSRLSTDTGEVTTYHTYTNNSRVASASTNDSLVNQNSPLDHLQFSETTGSEDDGFKISYGSGDDTMSDWSPTINIDLRPELGLCLFIYYGTEFLPSLLQPRAHPRYADFSYTLGMVTNFPTFRDAALACAAVSFSAAHPKWANVPKAMEYYTSAVKAIREGLESGRIKGTEDWLLATVLALCLFEDRKPSTTPQSIGVHVAALVRIIKIRYTERKMIVKCSEENSYLRNDPPDSSRMDVLLFERFCIEYLLYHGSILVLFDKDVDLLGDCHTWDIFNDYFLTFPSSIDSRSGISPVLGIPHGFYQLIATITRLTRRFPTLLAGDSQLIASCDVELSLLEEWLDSDTPINEVVSGGIYRGLEPNTNLAQPKRQEMSHMSSFKLYVFAARILVLRLSNDRLREALEQDYIRRGFGILRSLNIGCVSFKRYHLWPLYIFGYVALDERDVRVVKEKLQELRGNTDDNGILKWISLRIEEVMERRRNGDVEPL